MSASLDDFFSINITATTDTQTRAGFGTALLAVAKVPWTSGSRVRSYASLAELAAAGFLTTDPAYQMAAAVFAQNPRPVSVKIGQRTRLPTQIIHLTPATPVSSSAAETYTAKIDGLTATFTSDATPTVAEVCTGLAAAINALAGTPVTAVATGGTHIVCTSAVEGILHSYELVTENLGLRDHTTDPGLATDLNELLAIDPDFYGLALDSQSGHEVFAAAPWAEANRRLLVVQCADTGCGDPASTDDLLYNLKSYSLGYTTGWFYPAIGTAAGWLAAGLLGNRLPADPGSDTWAFKTIAGVAVLPLSTTARAAILAKHGNVYEVKNGVAVTFPGVVALGEFVDVVRGLDWTRARMQEALFALQTANAKVPFTDEGIRLVAAAIFGVLSAGVDVKLFAADPKPTVSAPRASAVSSANRSARHLPSVTFAAQLAGAIHTIAVTGTATA